MSSYTLYNSDAGLQDILTEVEIDAMLKTDRSDRLGRLKMETTTDVITQGQYTFNNENLLINNED